jgi:lipoprotein-anchoring transpeptidase ErfK/SrfK
MLARRPDLPRHMEGGPQNPLGARAMYLGSTLYRIHGSNEPWTIGTNVSSGCIRMRKCRHQGYRHLTDRTSSTIKRPLH